MINLHGAGFSILEFLATAAKQIILYAIKHTDSHFFYSSMTVYLHLQTLLFFYNTNNFMEFYMSILLEQIACTFTIASRVWNSFHCKSKNTTITIGRCRLCFTRFENMIGEMFHDLPLSRFQSRRYLYCF